MEFIQLAFLLTAVQLILFSRADMKLVVMQKVFRCYCCLNKNFLLSLFYFFFESSSLSSASIYPNLSILFRPQESFECVCVFTYSTKKFILSHHLHGACQFLPPVFTPLSTAISQCLKISWKMSRKNWLASSADLPSIWRIFLRFFYFNIIKRKFGESYFWNETFLKDF